MAVRPWADGAILRPHAAVDTAVLDDAPLDVVVYDERSRQLRYLNHSAAATWLLCDGTLDVAGVAAELVDIFGIEASLADDTVDAAVEAFWSSGLLHGSPPPSGVAADAADVGPNTSEVRVLPREPDP